jgi:hypothetical protein
VRNRYLILVLCMLFSGLLVLGTKADLGENSGPTVQVSVQVTDTSGGVLHYAWKSTDGQIKNVNASTTSWTLPSGTGFHFAYVLVSNGLGGYTERRIAINTDTLGSESESSENESSWVNNYHAPAGPAQVGDYWRSRVDLNSQNSAGSDVYVPGASVFLTDGTTGNRYPPSGYVTTDLKGEYVIPGVPPSTNETVTCLVGGAPLDCTPDNVMLNAATTHYLLGSANVPTPLVGTFTLSDNTTPCGTLNEFFGVHVTATATLVDSLGTALGSPVPVNEFGDYFFPSGLGAAAAKLSCENASPVIAPLSGSSFGQVALAGVTPPIVTGMTASLHGQLLASPVAKFLPPPSMLPSDIAPRADVYLAEKGLDSRLGACKYYLAIGAVRGCSPAGDLIGAISYDDWQRAVKIAGYAEGHVPTFHASYINKVDLNLARVHQSVSYSANKTAAVVCNHVGATDFFNPLQSDVDNAVLNAVNNKDLVACVAMDYMVSPGVNNNQPFIRFLIFGPSGQLLPSINLDGRREKFVPGTCVVCHGGDHYAGKFPEDGTGFANVGGHFLPYDAGNFEFALKPGLDRCAQEDQIYHLNQNVLRAGPNPAENELIAGWYSTTGSVTCPPSVKHILNEDYVPPTWTASGLASAITYYKDVNARSCRTCHVAMIEGYNFDHYTNVVNNNGTDQLPGGTYDFVVTACGGPNTQDTNTLRWYTMPNSLVTFNRFWLSYLNHDGLPDQATALINFANDTNNGGFCIPTPPQ